MSSQRLTNQPNHEILIGLVGFTRKILKSIKESVLSVAIDLRLQKGKIIDMYSHTQALQQYSTTGVDPPNGSTCPSILKKEIAKLGEKIANAEEPLRSELKISQKILSKMLESSFRTV